MSFPLYNSSIISPILDAMTKRGLLDDSCVKMNENEFFVFTPYSFTWKIEIIGNDSISLYFYDKNNQSWELKLNGSSDEIVKYFKSMKN